MQQSRGGLEFGESRLALIWNAWEFLSLALLSPDGGLSTC